MAESPQFYVLLARGMLPERPDLDRRHLALCRRRNVLRAGAKEAHRKATCDSPLRDAGFGPPLSVAGCDSLTVVKAEGLAAAGVPVAFNLDAVGRHRGTPIGLLVDRLGRPAAEVLDLHRKYMAACPRLLAPIRCGDTPGRPS